MDKKKYDLFELFTHLQLLMHRYQQYNRLVYGPMGDPHRGQGRILALLKMNPKISQKDLLYLLDMRPQSLGELLNKLEKNDIITRTSSEEDHRVMIIQLTEKGEKLVNQDDQSNFGELFSCLTEDEKTTLGDYLYRMIVDLEQQFGNESNDRSYDSRQEGFERFFGDRHRHFEGPFDDGRFGRRPDFRGRNRPFDRFYGPDFDNQKDTDE